MKLTLVIEDGGKTYSTSEEYLAAKRQEILIELSAVRSQLLQDSSIDVKELVNRELLRVCYNVIQEFSTLTAARAPYTGSREKLLGTAEACLDHISIVLGASPKHVAAKTD